MAPERRRAAWVSLLALVAVGVGFAAPAHAAKRPDLVITQARLLSFPYGFTDAGKPLTFRACTKNVGTARAGASATRLVISGDQDIPATTRAVPALAPGAQDCGSASHTYSFSGWKPGAYSLFVCADENHRVPEGTKEGNNCRDTHTKFFIAERIWSGSFTGEGGLAGGQSPDAKETWESNNVSWRFDEYLGDGRFRYLPRARVFFMDSGTDIGDCDYSSGGGGALSTVNVFGTLTVDYLERTYDGELRTYPFYVLHQDCPGTSQDIDYDGPRFKEGVFRTNLRSIPPGADRLTGNTQGLVPGDNGGGLVKWTWDLQ